MKWLRKRKLRKSALKKPVNKLELPSSEYTTIPANSKNLSNEKYQLFIDGQDRENRGLDLACNPYNGTVLGDVVLVSQSLLEEEAHENDHTVALFHRSKQ